VPVSYKCGLYQTPSLLELVTLTAALQGQSGFSQCHDANPEKLSDLLKSPSSQQRLRKLGEMQKKGGGLEQPAQGMTGPFRKLRVPSVSVPGSCSVEGGGGWLFVESRALSLDGLSPVRKAVLRELGSGHLLAHVFPVPPPARKAFKGGPFPLLSNESSWTSSLILYFYAVASFLKNNLTLNLNILSSIQQRLFETFQVPGTHGYLGFLPAWRHSATWKRN